MCADQDSIFEEDEAAFNSWNRDITDDPPSLWNAYCFGLTRGRAIRESDSEDITKLKEERDFAQGEVILKGAACAGLRDRLREARLLLSEAADSVLASQAEDGISDDRRAYRVNLEKKLRFASKRHP